MNNFKIILPPEGTFAYEFARLALDYCSPSISYNGEDNIIDVNDLREYSFKLRNIASEAKESNNQIWLSGNDKQSFLKKFMDWIGIKSFERQQDLLIHYAEKIPEIFSKKSPKFLPLSIFKLNYYEYIRKLGIRNIKPEFTLDGHQVALCMAGVYLARAGKIPNGFTVYVLLPHIPSLRDPKQRSEAWSVVKEVARELFSGETPSTAILILYITAKLLKAGIKKDGNYASLALVQEGGYRATLLSFQDLSTHGLIKYISRVEDKVLEVLKNYSRLLKIQKASREILKFKRLTFNCIEGFAQNLLLFSISNSQDALYLSVSLLRRFADSLKDPDIFKAAAELKLDVHKVIEAATYLASNIAEEGVKCYYLEG